MGATGMSIYLLPYPNLTERAIFLRGEARRGGVCAESVCAYLGLSFDETQFPVGILGPPNDPLKREEKGKIPFVMSSERIGHTARARAGARRAQTRSTATDRRRPWTWH